MKPLSILTLLGLGLLAAAFGASFSSFLSSRGGAMPITGTATGLVLLALAAALLVMGLPLRRYMRESEQRAAQPTSAPRRHQLDLPTAYRTILFARACAYTGSVVGGIFAGQALHLAITGIGTLGGAVVPTAFAALCGIVLAVLGVLVERWGALPPSDGETGGGRSREGSRESEPA